MEELEIAKTSVLLEHCLWGIIGIARSAMYRVLGILLLCVAAIAADNTPADDVEITLERIGCMGE